MVQLFQFGKGDHDYLRNTVDLVDTMPSTISTFLDVRGYPKLLAITVFLSVKVS